MSFEIIPAIDLVEGKCVRLLQGDYGKMTIYHDQPIEIAKRFEAHGLKRLHLVDLEGARKGTPIHLNTLEKIASQTSLSIDFSGGIQKEEQVNAVWSAGGQYVAIGTLAVRDSALFLQWINRWGASKFIVGADAKNKRIKVGGWEEETDIELIPFIEQYVKEGIVHFFCTDISKDGAMGGPSISLYKEIIEEIQGLQLLASGGVTTLDDLLLLEEVGCSGAIIGRAIYEETILLTDLEKRYAG